MLLTSFVVIPALICLLLLSHLSLTIYSPPLYSIWDTRRIPYIIDSQLDNDVNSMIHDAFRQISEATCVRFEQRTAYDVDYLLLTNGDKCEADVGKRGGSQLVVLNEQCTPIAGEIMHELLHVLGFHHEHQREDRELFVDVHEEHVIFSEKEPNFFVKSPLSEKITTLDYDYESITHYGRFKDSIDGSATITVRDSTKRGLIGQRRHLSSTDIQKIKIYYNCVDEPMLDRCDDVPAQPEHGAWTTVQGQEQRVGHIIEYSCDTGFTLIGPTLRTCLLDGSWRAYPPYCIQSPRHFCNFDADKYCGWTTSYVGPDSGYWGLNKRGTHDTETGPIDDHTTMASNGFFAFVEASGARDSNDIAFLSSPEIDTGPQPTCFRFAYSMFGRSTGELAVLLLHNDVERLLFSVSGGQGPNWLNKTISDLPTDATIQIRFRLKMPGRAKSDIALDDLLVTECSKLSQD